MSPYRPDLEHGCHCAVCPLGPTGALRSASEEWAPVPTEHHEGALALMIAQCPASEEVKQGRPLCGESGQELDADVRAVGGVRRTFSYANVLSCKPPGEAKGAWDRMGKQLSKLNKARAELNQDPLPHPEVCCRPRVEREVAMYMNIVPLGGPAVKAITKSDAGIFAQAGSTIEQGEVGEAGYKRIVPLYHPSFVMQTPKWREMWQIDLAKAIRWFTGQRRWVEPEVLLYPSVAQIHDWLTTEDAVGNVWVDDTETNSLDPDTCTVNCVGLAKQVAPRVVTCHWCAGTGKRLVERVAGEGLRRAPEHRRGLVCQLCEGARTRTVDHTAIVIPWVSRESPGYSPYTEAEQHWILGILRWHFGNQQRLKVGHNCVYTGTPVILGDGSSVPIESLVRSKYDGLVKALLPDGTFGTAQVTGWFRERVPDQRWLVLRREGEKGHSRGLTLTPDHEVYTRRGRIRADDVREGDRILCEEPQLDADQILALLGTLLGDSTCPQWGTTTRENGKLIGLKYPPTYGAALCITGGHSLEELTWWKCQWLPGVLFPGSRAVMKGGYKPGSVMYPYKTLRMRQIKQIAEAVYLDGGYKPRLTRKALDRLTAVGLAWLYMDDGFRHARDRKRENVLIATCGFSPEDREEGRAWFAERYGAATLTQNGSIRLSVDASQIFAYEIAPYVFPPVRYKLPKGDWPEFAGVPQRTMRPYSVRVESVYELQEHTGKSEAETRWCLQTTEGNFLTGFGFVKNCGSYDRAVYEQWLGMRPTPIVDTLFPARVRSPDISKALGVQGRVFTDVHSWKADNDGNKLAASKQDFTLYYYCALDSAVNRMIYDPLMTISAQKGALSPIRADVAAAAPWKHPMGWDRSQPLTLLAIDHRSQERAHGMHQNGMFIDQARRAHHEVELEKEEVYWRKVCVAHAHSLGVYGPAKSKGGVAQEFNPFSNAQVADILFNKWGVVPDEEDKTDTGENSVKDEVLRKIMTQGGPDGLRIDKAHFDFLDALRRCKRARKSKSTVLKVLRPDSWPEDDRGLCRPDGRVHPGWASHTTPFCRYSARGPGVQIVPARYRDVYAAPPGRVQIGCDVNAFHLRIIASKWRIQALIDSFAQGFDAHCLLAHKFFGDEFYKAPGWGGTPSLKSKPKVKDSMADRLRQVAKVMRYRGAYWDSPFGLWESVVGTENDEIDMEFDQYMDLDVALRCERLLPFADYTVEKINNLYQIWMRAEPEWKRAWWACKDRFDRDGYIETSLLKRRSGILEGGKKQAIANADILPEEPEIMRVFEERVEDRWPFGYAGPGTGIIHQGHDALQIEVPGVVGEVRSSSKPDGVDTYSSKIGKDRWLCWGRDLEFQRRELEECMAWHPTGWPVGIVSEAKVGRNYQEA